MMKSNIAILLSTYSISHAAVDAASLMLLFGGIDAPQNMLHYIVLYNVLAFGLQLPFGYLSDKLRKPAIITTMGMVLVAISLFVMRHATLAIILVGMGNALFHVGGGSVCLNLKPKKAALPGVFVSTGGLGLFAGIYISKYLGYFPISFAIALIILASSLLFIKAPKMNFDRSALNKGIELNTGYLAISLFLLAIFLRSLVGLSLEFDWKNSTTIILLISISVALGKGIGGFIADKLGWINATVWGLLLASISIYFGFQHAIFGLLALFLFNISMPITLVAISNMLPGKPGFAFGLTTMALLLGALPTFYQTKVWFNNDMLLIGLIILACGILFYGLTLYKKTQVVSYVSKQKST